MVGKLDLKIRATNEQSFMVSMTADGSVNTFHSSGFTMEHHVSQGKKKKKDLLNK